MLSFGGNSYTNIIPSHSPFKLSLSIKQAVKNSTVPLSSKNPKLILKYGPLPCNKLPPDSWLCLQSEFFDAHKNLKTEGSACFPYLWELPSLRHQWHCEDGRLLNGCHRSNQVPSDQTEMCAEPGEQQKMWFREGKWATKSQCLLCPLQLTDQQIIQSTFINHDPVSIDRPPTTVSIKRKHQNKLYKMIPALCKALLFSILSHLIYF